MVRLPPAEKLSLALRKNVRDELDNNKADLEKQLSDLLGAAWTIDINPLAIWPYHDDGYAKESLGSCIKAYIDGAIYQIKYQAGKFGDDFKNEVNTICSAHVLTMDVEEATPPRFSYGGCDVLDGKLRILFREKNLGTNLDYCCNEEHLTKALTAAPSDAPLNFLTRNGIRTEYDPKIAEARKKIADLLGKSEDAITLTPNFESNFAKLTGNKDVRDDWQNNLGSFTFLYFDAVPWSLKNMNVADDEMIREGVLEAVSTNEYSFRIVDKLQGDSSYCECVIEDGILYLQTTPGSFGTNIDYVAQKLMDLL